MLFIQLHSIFRRLTDILRKNPVRTTKIAGSLEVDDLAYNRSEADEGKAALTSGMLNLILIDYIDSKAVISYNYFVLHVY